MSDATFTPGPWRIRINGNIGNSIEAQSGRKIHPHDTGWRCVAHFQDCTNSDDALEQGANLIANGNLIAAAPDLFEALQLVKRLLNYTGEDASGFAAEVDERIDAALSKALPSSPAAAE